MCRFEGLYFLCICGGLYFYICVYIEVYRGLYCEIYGGFTLKQDNRALYTYTNIQILRYNIYTNTRIQILIDINT
jgi:hypothetical protein